MTRSCQDDTEVVDYTSTMADYQAPLPQLTTQQIFDQWLGVIRRHECASIISLPKFDRHYRVAQFIQEKGAQLKDTQLLSIWLESLVTEEKAEFIQRLNQLRQPSDKQTVFLVLDGEWLLTGAPRLLPVIQEYVLTPYRQTSFLVFFETNILDPQIKSLFSSCSALLQNITFQKLYSKADIEHFLSHLAFLYGYDLKKTDKSKIIDNCAGYIWLATEALRYLHTTGKLSFTHPEMQFRLQAIWEGFHEREKAQLKSLAFNQTQNPVAQAQFAYFTKTNLISNHGLTVPILNDYIKQLFDRQYKLAVSTSGQLLFNQVNVEQIFSERERELLKHLLNHEGQLVLRDTVGEILWSDKWLDTGSDWALDQAMMRLRRRLRQLGPAKETIKTIKGKGFIYVT